jgi:hypothetical protein
MEPFDKYPDWLKEYPKCIGGASCRYEYGLRLQRITGQTTCAYCGLDMAGDYRNWLQLSVDHVIPVNTITKELPEWKQWVENAFNKVICCRACNEFFNQHKLKDIKQLPTSWEEFENIRDEIFLKKKEIACARHGKEYDFFLQRKWEAPLTDEEKVKLKG